ncbi:lipopolysaccharide transport system permease protein [Mucilaginibacter yixingensis]|uniref:Transport permease protein n=1 Tax=Mucilaginibacter yixingensis TaxID=1295612 RepID=A0A2T5JC70_9SPHI|nr:ABC transporter permease [Mucilaginibacter yixingensis]PTQ99363.1 lipopolysaccharide transport system permease protein [Mucilaginibacter yixingensis]
MEVNSENENWDLEIRANDNLFNLHLKDVWNYRDLLWLLVRRDFVSFYKQTILGPLWFFIQPIFTTLVFTVIFNQLANIKVGSAPPMLFYMAGTVSWNYFSDCLTKTSTVFRDNSAIFGKVYFPRLIMPLSIVVSNLVKFGVQFILFTALLVFFMFKGLAHPNAYICLFPIIMLLMALLGLGVGLIVTAMTTKYRDLTFVVTFGMQLLMYATPIIYPLAAAPQKYRWIIALNPMCGLVETFRYGFIGAGQFYSGAFFYSVAASLVVMVLGLVVFNKVEKNFVDTV